MGYFLRVYLAIDDSNGKDHRWFKLGFPNPAVFGMDFKFDCPHCNQCISAEPEHTGLGGNCPGCGKPIVVPTFPIIRSVLPFVPQGQPASDQVAVAKLMPKSVLTPPPPLASQREKLQQLISHLNLTKEDILLCVVMVIPAILAAKVLVVGILGPFVKGFVGSPLAADDQRIIDFLLCIVSGFIFVWIGQLGTRTRTRQLRKLSIWFFLFLAVIGAIGVYPMNGDEGLPAP